MACLMFMSLLLVRDDVVPDLFTLELAEAGAYAPNLWGQKSCGGDCGDVSYSGECALCCAIFRCFLWHDRVIKWKLKFMYRCRWLVKPADSADNRHRHNRCTQHTDWHINT